MQSKAATVKEYLGSLPDDRREAIEAVRRVILKNLDKDYEEGMQYGMIGYYVPHRVYPAGYHCDPRQALPFAGLASQKGHMSLYLMCTYGESDLKRWFVEAWGKTGKKLDMGKACIRFKRLEDVALDVVGEVVRRVPARAYVEHTERLLAAMGKGPGVKKGAPAKSKGAAAKAGGARTAKTTAKKASRRAKARRR